VNLSGACLFSLDTTSNTGTTVPATSTYTDQVNSNLGTSFSAPIVAGIAGLMMSVNGNLMPGQLIARLREGAKPFPVSSDSSVPTCHVPAGSSDLQAVECNCTTQTCGAGMANAPGAVNAALRPIAAVAVPASVSAGQNIVLHASGSAAACGHSISSYSWTNLTTQDPIQGANTSAATVVASGNFTIRLTVTDDAGRQDAADVVISTTSATTSAPTIASNALGCPKPVSVTLNPTSASVEASGGTQAFSATVANSLDSTVSWQVNGVTGGTATTGTISAGGVYTAPSTVPTSATVTVSAVSNADATKGASAQVTVTPMITVAVSPSSASVAVSASESFSATVRNSSNAAVTWQVNGVAGGNATVGTISGAGLYTAPMTVPSPATVSVTAVSAADAARSASTQVTIVPAASAATSAGSSSGASGGSSAGGSSGGGDMDAVTLLAVALAAGAAMWRRRRGVVDRLATRPSR
jgi:hypothetical protein